MPNVIEIKFNKRLFINFILVLIVALAFLETVEMGIIFYGLKTGIFCK